ncbi:MAG: respiratory nitrate reductase subunit gamma [Thermodesulfobacteriota bacterium]
MADKFWYFVMVPMVYLSAAWCVVWLAVKVTAILHAPKLPHTVRIFPEDKGPDDPAAAPLVGAIIDSFTMPSVKRYQPCFWWFLILFHGALLLLLVSHLDVLPQINLMSSDSPHMIGNGAVGVLVTVALLYFLFRRFRTPVREVSVPGDYLMVLLLLCIAVSGDMISWGNSWAEGGFGMTKQDFGTYMESLIRFTFSEPQQVLHGGHLPVIGTHVLLVNLFLLLLPFSKLVHFLFAVPLNKLRRG